jgi:rubredoxin
LRELDLVAGCTLCGYRYDATRGDSTSGVPPGTHFDDLPIGWHCPRCGADRAQFMKVPRAP